MGNSDGLEWDKISTGHYEAKREDRIYTIKKSDGVWGVDVKHIGNRNYKIKLSYGGVYISLKRAKRACEFSDRGRSERSPHWK